MESIKLQRVSSILKGKGEGARYIGISADGNSRQHAGDVYNNYAFNYTLRQRRSDETLQQSRRDAELLKAAANGHTPRVQYPSAGADRDYTDNDGFTALHHGVLSGYEDVTSALIVQGWDVDAENGYGTPLCLAALKARKKIASLLLQYRANVNMPCSMLGSALHAACIGGDLDIVNTLLDHGAQLNALRPVSAVLANLSFPVNGKPDLIMIIPPIAAAAISNHLDLLKVLCDRGADVDCESRLSTLNAPDDSLVAQITALHLAVDAGQLGSLRILLENKADPDRTDSVGQTALIRATLGCNQRCIVALIEAGAALDQVDARGNTALHNAIIAGEHNCVARLLEAGASMGQRNSNGLTPLRHAARLGRIRILQELIQHGVDLHATDETGQTILHEAARRWKAEVVDFFISAGLGLDISDDEGYTAVHRAASRSTTAILQALIDAGANVNVCDREGETPLHHAAASGSARHFSQLLRAGADVNARNCVGATPFDVANSVMLLRKNEALRQTVTTSGREGQITPELIKQEVVEREDETEDAAESIPETQAWI